MALTYRPVTGRYLNIDGSPKYGYVEFTPTSDLVRTNDSIMPISTVRMTLDENGIIAGELACTDNPGVLPAGWLWNVEEKMREGEHWWLQVVTGDGSPLDISSLRGVGVPPPFIAAGPPGPPGPMGPPGGAAREVYTITSATTLQIKDKVDFLYIAMGTFIYSVTMPTALNNASRYTIKRYSNYTITVLPAAGQYIDGGASFVLGANKQSIDLISNSVDNWMVV